MTVELTDRERELVGLVAGGHGYKDAASHLTISLNTVRFHLRNAYRKLDAVNCREAAAKMEDHTKMRVGERSFVGDDGLA